MLEARIILMNEVGLHARPAAMLVKCAAKFKSQVTVSCRNKAVNAKSIIAVLSLGVGKGDEITIAAEGPDEAACIEELKGLVEKDFSEV
ncbi:MAG TPA: HPr family phosphocarrier protein [Negativicutes bacterium]|nr:HPr family phosphocarrier protein [Negativicutes bacterium]